MEGSTVGMSDVVITALTGAGSQATAYVTSGITALIPAAANIMALCLGVRLAFGFFKSIAH